MKKTERSTEERREGEHREMEMAARGSEYVGEGVRRGGKGEEVDSWSGDRAVKTAMHTQTPLGNLPSITFKSPFSKPNPRCLINLNYLK